MNSLEKYLRDNKSLFDQEPPAGHLERFEQKMKRKPTRIIAMRQIIAIAASIAILLSVSALAWQHFKKLDETLICENAGDIKNCYLKKMNIVAGQIDALTQNFDQFSRQQLMNDVIDIINIANDDFENELPEELPEDVARTILTDHYNQILESLELIVNQLEVVNNS